VSISRRCGPRRPSTRLPTAPARPPRQHRHRPGTSASPANRSPMDLDTIARPATAALAAAAARLRRGGPSRAFASPTGCDVFREAWSPILPSVDQASWPAQPCGENSPDCIDCRPPGSLHTYEGTKALASGVISPQADAIVTAGLFRLGRIAVGRIPRGVAAHHVSSRLAEPETCEDSRRPAPSTACPAPGPC